MPFNASLLLLAGSLCAQFEVHEQSAARRMTSVTWFGMSGTQRVTIDYSPPTWRAEYETAVHARTAQDVYLGNGWTTLQNNVDLEFGDKKLPRGRWYLGLHRDDTAAWTLSLTAADRVDADEVGFRTHRLQPYLRAPLRLEAKAAPVDVLEITLDADGKQKQNVALSFAWGPYRLRTDLIADIDRRVHPGTPEFALSPKEKLVTTASGLQYEKLRAGAGAAPAASDHVKVHYAGWLTDGTLFDSSYWRGEATGFPVHAVVKGFAEGLQLMQPGASYRFTIPPALAYGERAVGDIPPNSTLVFVVTLVEIRK